MREDYSADGNAWNDFPFEHANARAYRWGEDGIAGVSDNHQFECVSFAFWNEKDDILKERLFGVTGPQGNHGEDAKEEYFYLDNTPTHSYMKYLYKYPQSKFPYEELVSVNGQKSKTEPEFELSDTGIFDENRYFDIFIEMGKETEEDLLFRVTAYNRGPDSAPLHIIPQAWFRNTWDWGYDKEQGQGILVNGTPPDKPTHKILDLGDGIAKVDHWRLGDRYLQFAISPGFGDEPEFSDDEENDDVEPELMFTDNVTNKKRLYSVKNDKDYKYCKDGFDNHVVKKEKDAINPERTGTKVGAWYKFDRDGGIPSGDFVTVRFKFTKGKPTEDLDEERFDSIMDKRQDEADDFYFHVSPLVINEELRTIQRQALAGMLWTKQFYYFVQSQWSAGDPSQPPPPPQRKDIRNGSWRHLHVEDILSLPDKWEYPFFAAWDTAFHCIPLAMIDPEFAKKQLDLLTREWYMHPNGQIPAYEWNFSDVNPPVHAWATFRVYKMERKMYGREDVNFLERVFQKLLLNFTWWVNRKDVDGQNVFEGGFLGLDNIGLFNRSEPLPTGGVLEQADSTGWMAFFSLQMLSIALELAKHRPVYEDIASKFFEHFILIADAMTFRGEEGEEKSLWNEEDGFYYDAISWGGPWSQQLPVRSLVGLIPLYASLTLEPEVLDKFKNFSKRVKWFVENRSQVAARNMASMDKRGSKKRILLSLVNEERLVKILDRMLDETEFLSDYGIRSLSKYHKDHPYSMNVNGQDFVVDYVPGDSNSGLFGGNSNWRGPIWFPTNFLLIESLQRFYLYFGDSLKIEYPKGSGEMMHLAQVAEKLQHRLIKLFADQPCEDKAGNRRAYNGGDDLHDLDDHFKENILFYEFFDADTGRGLGAKHQCGWTGLVAKLIHDTGISYRIRDIENVSDPIASADLFFDDVVSKGRYHSRRGSNVLQTRMSSKNLANMHGSQSSHKSQENESRGSNSKENEAQKKIAEHIRRAVARIKLNEPEEPDEA